VKAATTTLINFLENATTYVRADLYTFTLNSGAVIRYTSANAPVTTTITVNGATQGPYTWNVGPPISDEGVQSSRGVNAASVDITINGGTGVWTVNGLDILDFIEGFGLDGAGIRIDRAWAPDWPTMFGAGPTGTHCRFSGLFTEAKELGETQAVVTVQDPRSVLQTQYPAEVYSTSCLNVFGDANCGVAVSAPSQSATVIGASSTTAFNMSLVVANNAFTGGIVTFTSGANKGVSCNVEFSAAAGNGVMLATPLPYEPAVGDTFNISPASLTQAGAVIGSSNQLAFNMNLVVADNAFTLGVVTFTSGENAGISRSIKYNAAAGNGVMLTAPLPAQPAIGDTFTISPGCSLALSSTGPQGCQQWQPSTWAERFRGQPFVPPPTTGLPT